MATPSATARIQGTAHQAAAVAKTTKPSAIATSAAAVSSVIVSQPVQGVLAVGEPRSGEAGGAVDDGLASSFPDIVVSRGVPHSFVW